MCHDWIFDVLSDLKAYAIQNNLPALAAKVEEALEVARLEIAAKEDETAGAAGRGGPPSGRTH